MKLRVYWILIHDDGSCLNLDWNNNLWFFFVFRITVRRFSLYVLNEFDLRFLQKKKQLYTCKILPSQNFFFLYIYTVNSYFQMLSAPFPMRIRIKNYSDQAESVGTVDRKGHKNTGHNYFVPIFLKIYPAEKKISRPAFSPPDLGLPFGNLQSVW